MRGYKTMYDYRGKIAGMVVAGVGLLTLVVQKLTHFTLTDKLNSDQHFNILMWVTLLGLFTMMFSYERNEDERVKLIRAKSFIIVFAMMTGSILAFALTVTIMPKQSEHFEDVVMKAEDVIMAGRMLMFYPAVAIAIYLIIFHIGVYYDWLWDYSDNIGFIENLRKNFVQIIVLAIAGMALVSLIFLLLQ